MKEQYQKTNSKIVVPEAKAAMNKFKMEAANEVGVILHQNTRYMPVWGYLFFEGWRCFTS